MGDAVLLIALLPVLILLGIVYYRERQTDRERPEVDRKVRRARSAAPRVHRKPAAQGKH